MLLIKKKGSEDTDEIEDNHFDEYFANHVDTICYKYTENLYSAFISAFSYLPISATVNKTSFCIHGGICPKLDRIDNINTMITRLILKKTHYSQMLLGAIHHKMRKWTLFQWHNDS